MRENVLVIGETGEEQERISNKRGDRLAILGRVERFFLDEYNQLKPRSSTRKGVYKVDILSCGPDTIMLLPGEMNERLRIPISSSFSHPHEPRSQGATFIRLLGPTIHLV